jgi:hypothetical protein
MEVKMTNDATRAALAARVRRVLKEHQREGLNMIGNVDQLVNTLVHTVGEWIEEQKSADTPKRLQEKKSA